MRTPSRSLATPACSGALARALRALLVLSLVWSAPWGCSDEGRGPGAADNNGTDNAGTNNAGTGATVGDTTGATNNGGTSANNGGTSTNAGTTSGPDAGGEDAADVSADAAEDAVEAPDAPDRPDAQVDASPEDATPDAPGPEDVGGGDDASPPDAAPDAEEDAGAPLLRVLTVTPDRGPVAGGQLVEITVDGALEAPVVFFGARRATQVEVLTPTFMTAVTPANVAGDVDVKVFVGAESDVLEGGFRYFEPLRIDAVSPQRSPTAGGQLVELQGEAFTEGMEVSVGGRSAIQTEVVDGQTAYIITPPGPAGPATVRVTDADSSARLEGAVVYFERLELRGLFPASGPRQGGNTVAVLGRGLTPDAVVRIGGVSAPVTFLTSERVDVIVPPGPVGAADVEVFTSAGAVGLLDGYTYTDGQSEGLALSGISPAQGPSAGGQEVLLSGQGFDDDALEVRFGGALATLVEVSDRALRVRTPEGAPGVVDVEVRHQNGDAALAEAYTFVETLEVTGVAPNTGPTEGGTTVTVQGSSFGASTQFWFGPLEAVVLARSADGREATVSTPPGSLGWAPLVVRDGLQTVRIEEGFLYSSPPSIASIEPQGGSIAGGTLLTIRGRGFYGDPAVTLDGLPCADVEVLDQASLTCRTPARREGVAEVQVRLTSGPLVAPERFTYFNPASRFGGAWGEPVEGTVNVSVFSIGGSPIEDAFVMLSTNAATPYQGTTDANGLVTFSGGDVLGEQFVTATAPGYSSATVQSVNAENVTLLLFPVNPPTGGGGGTLPLATITGVVGGFPKIKEPGPNERQVIIVETTRESPWRSNPWPGQGNVVDANGDGTYTLTSRVGDLAVVAIGGLVNTQTGKFTPYAMGIERYLFLNQDETRVVNIELDIDLNNVLAFKLNGAQLGAVGEPLVPNINRVTPWIDLGIDGFFTTQDVAEGTGDILEAVHQPPLVGDLADGLFYVYGGSLNGFSQPYSLSVIPALEDTDALIELPDLISVPVPGAPLDGGLVRDGYVSFETRGDTLPDFWNVQIFQLPSTLAWEVTLPGNQTWFQLPAFPDFTDLPAEDRPTPYAFYGQLYMVISGAVIEDFSFDQYEYLNDVRRRDRWVSWTRQGYYIFLNP